MTSRRKQLTVLITFAAVAVICTAQPSSPVGVSISTKTPVAKAGDTIKLRIVVTNISDRPISALQTPGTTGQAEAVNQIEVRDTSGKNLPRIDGRSVSKEGKTYTLPKRWLSRKSVNLNPGEKLEDFAIISNLFDLSRPGQYSISVRNEMYADSAGPSLKWIYTTSNTLKISVAP